MSILPPSCPLRQIKGFADGAAIEAKPGSGERRGCEVALTQHRLVGGNTLLRLTSPLLVPTEKVVAEMPRTDPLFARHPDGLGAAQPIASASGLPGSVPARGVAP